MENNSLKVAICEFVILEHYQLCDFIVVRFRITYIIFYLINLGKKSLDRIFNNYKNSGAKNLGQNFSWF
jgi:hypothetical protein